MLISNAVILRRWDARFNILVFLDLLIWRMRICEKKVPTALWVFVWKLRDHCVIINPFYPLLTILGVRYRFGERSRHLGTSNYSMIWSAGRLEPLAHHNVP